MNRIKMFFIRRIGLSALTIAGCLLLAHPALAIGTIHFNAPGAVGSTNILDQSGATITSSLLQNGSNQVQFFYGSAADPTAASNVPAADLSAADPNYPRKYVFNSYGHSINVRVWSGSPGTKGSFFGYTGSGFQVNANQASYAQADLLGGVGLNDGTQNVPSYAVVAGLTTNHKYDNPYPPSVGNFTESYVRVPGSNDVSLQLTVAANYTDTVGGIIIPATSYKWEVWDAINGSEGAAKTYSGSSILLTTNEVAPGGTYNFKVQAFNWFPDGSAWSATKSYTLLAIGLNGVVTVPHTYALNAPVSDQNVTPTAMCFGSLTTGVNDTSLSLADYINKNVVNPGTGFYVTAIYQENSGLYTFFDSTGAVTAGTNSFVMTPREPVQIYTTAGGSFTL